MLAKFLQTYISGPEHRGKYRVVQWLGRHVVPARGVVGTVHPGERLWLHPLDWVDYHILKDGRYEPLTLDFLRTNLRPGDRSILAGINNGLHVIVAARAAGAAGLTIGCDPQPAALLRTRANLELSGLSTAAVRLVAAALGRAPALVPVSWPPSDNPGAASLLSEGEGFLTTVVDLAGLATACGLDRVRLLLLDVQGYECEVLAGLGATLRPEIAVIEDAPEFFDRASPGRVALHDLLRSQGYALHDLYGQPVDAGGPPICENNLVGLQPGVEFRWLQR